MGLFNKIGANKNDVKIAKMELEKEKRQEKKEKVKSKEQKRLDMIERSKSLAIYTMDNIDKFVGFVDEYEGETKTLVDEVLSKDPATLSFKEKGDYKKKKNQATDRVRYLYLVKDYFTFVDKVINNLPMKDNQYLYIIKFIPFFDGTDVIEESDDEDNSLVGELNFIKKEIFGMFYSSDNESSFAYEDFFGNYEEKIKKLNMPNLTSLINGIKKHVSASSPKEEAKAVENKQEATIVCSNCGYNVNATAKFCPECGNKIELPKKKFCSECGAELSPTSKFCPECGNKVA